MRVPNALKDKTWSATMAPIRDGAKLESGPGGECEVIVIAKLGCWSF
jgi:hypothetical protein